MLTQQMSEVGRMSAPSAGLGSQDLLNHFAKRLQQTSDLEAELRRMGDQLKSAIPREVRVQALLRHAHLLDFNQFLLSILRAHQNGRKYSSGHLFPKDVGFESKDEMFQVIKQLDKCWEGVLHVEADAQGENYVTLTYSLAK